MRSLYVIRVHVWLAAFSGCGSRLPGAFTRSWPFEDDVYFLVGLGVDMAYLDASGPAPRVYRAPQLPHLYSGCEFGFVPHYVTAVWMSRGGYSYQISS